MTAKGGGGSRRTKTSNNYMYREFHTDPIQGELTEVQVSNRHTRRVEKALARKSKNKGKK